MFDPSCRAKGVFVVSQRRRFKNWPLMAIIGRVVACTVGVVLITCQLLESLTQTTDKMETYKIKKNLNAADGMFAMDRLVDQMQHDFSKEAEVFFVEANKQSTNLHYEKASQLLSKSLDLDYKYVAGKPLNYRQRKRLAGHHVILSSFYFRLKRYENALTQVSIAMKLIPGDPQYFAKRSSIYTALGEPKLAEADLQESSRLLKFADDALHESIGRAKD